MIRLSKAVLRRALAIVLGAAANAAIAQPGSSAGHALEASDVNPWLDGYMPYAMRTADVAGAVVVVVKDGKLVTARGYGWADAAAHRPVDAQRTMFRVGSISKLFTWTAVMQQVEAGKLDLDRDVNEYLDFRIPPRDGKPITLRQLMTHTAGFELAGKDTITFGAPIPLDTFLKRWIPRRIYAPGTTPAYSNWGAALAGYIVQRVSGVPYATYIQQRIFSPLGMADATFAQPLPSQFTSQISRGYLRASAGPLPFEIIGPFPAGALSASGPDIGRFMIAHLEAGRGLMKPATAAMMHNSPLHRVDPASLIPPLNRMELGFIESNINGHEVIGHGGDTQQFHSLLALFINDGIGLFVSVNSAGRDNAGYTVRSQLFEDFADRYFPATENAERVPADLARQHARMMTGTWLGSGRAESSFLSLISLGGQAKVSLTPDGGLLVPSLKDASGAPMQWDEVAPFLWKSRSGHERLAAKVVDGKIVRWAADSFAPIQVFDRAPVYLSAGWILPSLGASILVLVLTIILWPVTWFVRRRYGASLKLDGAAQVAYRAARIASLLEIAVLCGWLMLLAAMFSNFDWIGRRSDGWLRVLELSGLIIFVCSPVIMAWNAVVTWRGVRAWLAMAWSIATFAAALVLLYFSYFFGLLSQSTNY